MRFKYSDKKFSGNVGECWMDYVDEYAKASMVSMRTKRSSTCIIYSLETQKSFKINEVEPHAGAFQQAVDFVNNEYNLIARQTKVKNI